MKNIKSEESSILKQSKFNAISAADFADEEPEFVWYPYIPRGEYTVLMADGGTGKTTFCCGIAAAISNGTALPSSYVEENPTHGNVLIITGEERGGMLKKQLKACDADLSRISILDCMASEGLTFSEENEFQLVIEKYSPELVIIDPWHCFLGASVDINRVNAVRPVFQKLANIAKSCNCGIILVSHVNKRAQAENANNAATGSTDFINAARSAIKIIFSEEPGEENIRIAVHTKSNHASAGQSLKYKITHQKGLEWNGFSDIDRNALEKAARCKKTPFEIMQKNVDTNSALFDAIQEKAVFDKHINISYDQLKDEFGTYIFETNQPPFCIFENVDRLIKSPSKQRGRDFGIILACLAKLGYSAEWRVVNAAQYGGAQKRKRTFIFAYRNDTQYCKKINSVPAEKVIECQGFMAKAFPVQSICDISTALLNDDISKSSNSFTFDFQNSGYMKNNTIYTSKVIEKEDKPITLGEILQDDVDLKYYIPVDKLPRWEYLKGAKKIPRRNKKTGFKYIYSECAVAYPDSLDKPARTMLTSEATINRSSHVVMDPQTALFRTITPIEAERLQGFDDNWTNTGMSDRMRYLCMGNSLVVPMVTRMAKVLNFIIEEEL